MNMFASAKTMTRGDLRKAFDDYAEAHGHELATLALARSTGQREVSAVPQERIINGMVELIGGYSFVSRHTRSRPQCMGNPFANVHVRLEAIREKAFGRYRPA